MLATDKVASSGSRALVVAETRYLARMRASSSTSTTRAAGRGVGRTGARSSARSCSRTMEQHRAGPDTKSYATSMVPSHALTNRERQPPPACHQNVRWSAAARSTATTRHRGALVWTACQGVHSCGRPSRQNRHPDRQDPRAQRDVGGRSAEDRRLRETSSARSPRAVGDRSSGSRIVRRTGGVGQAREESFEVDAAITDEGDILGIKVKMSSTPGLPGDGTRLGRSLNV